MPGRSRSFPSFAAASSCSETRDAQRLPDHRDLFRSKRRDSQPRREFFWDFFFYFFKKLKFACVQQLVNFFSDGFAHARDFEQLPFFPKFAGFARQADQTFRRFAIGERFVNDLAFDLQEIGDERERVGKLFVVHGGSPMRLYSRHES
jgi:hypothetical protein